MTEAQTAAPAAPQAETADNGNFINFDELPPDVRQKVEPRFKELYWKLKENERGLVDLGKHTRSVEEKLSAFESSQIAAKAATERERLRTEKKAALERADYDRVVAIDEQLVEQAKPKPEVRPAAPALAAEEERTVETWASEIDASGNFRRPWAQPKHPNYKRVVALTAEIAESAEFANRPLPEILKEVDKRIFGSQRATATAAPPSTNTRPPTKTATELSPDERRVAERMFFNSKVVKTKEEAYDKYRKARA